MDKIVEKLDKIEKFTKSLKLQTIEFITQAKKLFP